MSYQKLPILFFTSNNRHSGMNFKSEPNFLTEIQVLDNNHSYSLLFQVSSLVTVQTGYQDLTKISEILVKSWLNIVKF